MCTLVTTCHLRHGGVSCHQDRGWLLVQSLQKAVQRLSNCLVLHNYSLGVILLFLLGRFALRFSLLLNIIFFIEFCCGIHGLFSQCNISGTLVHVL